MTPEKMDPAALRLHTVASLAEAFATAGLQPGMTILMHSRLRSVGGWICGGAETVVEALQQVLTPAGTLMMPTHTSNNSDPQYWQHPPVPAEWWQPIRDQMPAYTPATAITRLMGTLAEHFRTRPEVIRSSHPLASFAAWGANAALLTREQPLEAMFGEQSPLRKLVDLGGYVFLLGLDHDTTTLMHLAEHRIRKPRVQIMEGSTLLIEGKRTWVRYTMPDYDDAHFRQIGADYEANNHPHQLGQVGQATTRLLPARSLVDYAVWWLDTHEA